MTTPWHFWPVSLLALLCFAIGAIDYLALQYDWMPWIGSVSPEWRGQVDQMPGWADGAWAVMVWAGLVGAVVMLARASLAPLILAISTLGLLVLAVWLVLVASPPIQDALGGLGVILLLVLIAASLLLWFYARSMHKAGIID